MATMDAIVVMAGVGAMQAAVGVVLSAPILYFGRKRISWAKWLLLALVIPFLIWAGLMFSPLSSGRKSLANLGEPIYISIAMPVFAIIRVLVGKKMSER